MEPPYWYYPVEQTLGAVQLEAGNAEAAARHFQAALVKAPGNGWSLFGLREAKLAMGDKAAAEVTAERLQQAWVGPDPLLRLDRLYGGPLTDRTLALRLRRRRALALSALCGLALAIGRPALASEAGIVTALHGAATATADGAARVLHVGAAVRQQDSILTAAGARLRLTLADGSTLTLGENSQLVLSQVVMATNGGGGSMVFDLLSGIVRAVLGPSPPELFEVRGRAAVAAARSTDFVVETATGATSIFVATGAVAVSAAYGSGDALLTAGEGIDVERVPPRTRSLRFGPGRPDAPELGRLGSVRPWGRARIDSVIARTLVDD